MNYKIVFFSILISLLTSKSFAANLGPEYGCVIWPNIYPSYDSQFTIDIAYYKSSGFKQINNNCGGNGTADCSRYTCGRINYGFGTGTQGTNDIDLDTDYGNCRIIGTSNYGRVRKYAQAVCNVPLDDYIPFLILVFGAFGFYFVKTRRSIKIS